MPITNEQQAIDFINEINKKHYDAAHNVYAYVLKDNNIRRYSDDGEPAGTAGVPVLDVILKEDITDACIVVTRYFGGTLLGAGGLVRAYTKGAKCAIETAGIKQRRFSRLYAISCGYSLLGKVQSAIAQSGCINAETVYTDSVLINCYVPYDVTGFENRLTDVTNGKVTINVKDEGRFIDVN